MTSRDDFQTTPEELPVPRTYTALNESQDVGEGHPATPVPAIT